MLWPNEASEITTLTDDHYFLVGTKAGDKPQKVLNKNLSSKYYQHSGTTSTIYWGDAANQIAMTLRGYGFASGNFQYDWGSRFDTDFFKINATSYRSRFQYFDNTILKLFHGSTNTSWTDGTEVLVIDAKATTLATPDGINKRRVIISGGFDNSQNQHFTVINGTPKSTTGTSAPYYFARVGETYSAYYFHKGNPAMTFMSGYPSSNVLLWDGLGSDQAANVWAEITSAQIRFNKPVNVGALNTTAQDVRGAINELKASAGSGGALSLTSHNYTKDSYGIITSWYRKYSDGFIEQGGAVRINDFWVDGNERLIATVNFYPAFNSNPVNTNITFSGNVVSAIASMHIEPGANTNKTQAKIYIRSVNNLSFQYGGNYIYWEAKGY